MKICKFLYSIIIIFITINTCAQKSKAESIENGSIIYQDFCIRCHGVDGNGNEGLIPPLKSSDYLLNNIHLSIAGLKYGLKGEITVNGSIYNGYMANQNLQDQEIADVMNYILNEWGNDTEDFITSELVNKITKSILEK